MTSRLRLSLVLFFCFALASLFAPIAEATTVKLVNDARLVDQAPIAIVARVEGTQPAPELDRPVTDYLVTVERVLKGTVGESTLLVRVPGGRAASGLELKIWGAPTFVEGERTLLFLGRHADGTYRILHVMLGAFRQTEVDGHAVAYRDLSEVDLLDDTETQSSERRKMRDFDRFADWIADRAAHRLEVPNYYLSLAPESSPALLPMFTLLGDGGRSSRWFEFDSGGQINWRIDADPLAGFSGDPSAAFRTALAAWNAESHTPIKYNLSGTSGLVAGFDHFDGQNVLLFDDPNADVEGSFSCSTGGTLAVGGPWFDPDTTGRFNGETFIRIQGADIVLNDGIACFFERSANPTKALEELLAHETGHTLGLGHSSENAGESNTTLRDALMFFRIHNDGRGARLSSDDIAGLRRLYDKSANSGGGGGGSNGCPANTLCLVNKRFQVTGVWSNQFNGQSGTAGTIANTDLAGFLYFSDPNNIELIVKVLDFGDRVAFFYGQLTNLRFTLSVLDTRTGTTKTYTNTPGDCGALDNTMAASSAAIFETGDSTVGEPGLLAQAACQSSATAVCLLGGRFRLELDWQNQFDSSSGQGKGKKLSDLTAAFSFTDPANLEVLVKTLDFGDHVLVLYGTLSNLAYTLRVTETTTGRVKTYVNAPGNYCGGLDNNAF